MVPRATLGTAHSQLLPSPGKASGRESRSAEMKVDGVATAAPADLSGAHGCWSESRYRLTLKDGACVRGADKEEP